ncbi:C40 family peptidase [Tessaracoccus caeni]|uniref:C40 family peptidase n=1 Tax=Tessaracoccus caeni TaxID=3031239 RepID=UPI0023DCB62C|nr:C40 family peptidase [Tessaracoccus caeni]MDF1488887.1 NlpC/P60 family protein [Tessaracoccus caeni]
MKFSKTLIALTCSLAVGLGMAGAPMAHADETVSAETTAAAATSTAKKAAAVKPQSTSTKITTVPKNVTLGDKVTVKGSVKPARKVTVSLQRWTGEKWTTIAKTKTSSKGTYSVKAKLSKKGNNKLRVTTPASKTYEASKSLKPVVKVKAAKVDKAKLAVRAAMAKVGKSYRHGATGPNAFDCSGLTTYAFKQVGIKLPRTSRAQLSAGKRVSKSNLKPGDLVFFYSPVSHVAIYIGDGEIVHAGNRRTGVNVTKMKYMPFAGARRVA